MAASTPSLPELVKWALVSRPPALPQRRSANSPRQLRHIALEHDGPAPAQLFFNCGYDMRMVMPRVMNTVSREEIQDSAPIRAEEFSALAVGKLNIHLQHVQQSDPLWVYIRRVLPAAGNKSWH